MPIKDVLEFDILNQKLKAYGQLNVARISPGVVTCKKYLWVFGGCMSYHDGYKAIDCVEKSSLQTGGGVFEKINL